MADKKVNAVTGEVQEEKKFQFFDRQREDLEHEEDGLNTTMSARPHPELLLVHCKPVYNYQSVEFDVLIHKGLEEVDFAYMENLYKGMLEMLIRVSQIAPQAESKKSSAPVEEPATEAQKQILRNFHIDFKPDITKKQAHALIKKSMDQEIF